MHSCLQFHKNGHLLSEIVAIFCVALRHCRHPTHPFAKAFPHLTVSHSVVELVPSAANPTTARPISFQLCGSYCCHLFAPFLCGYFYCLLYYCCCYFCHSSLLLACTCVAKGFYTLNIIKGFSTADLATSCLAGQ